jgi:hypothetical protein
MARVWVEIWWLSLRANKFKNLMLTFSWNKCIWQNYRQVLPKIMIILSFHDVISQSLCYVFHESSSWCNCIAIKFPRSLFIILDIFFIAPFLPQVCFFFYARLFIHCLSESSSSLLVQFWPGSYSINRHIDNFSWFSDSNNCIYVFENGGKNFFFTSWGDSCCRPCAVV